MVIKRHNFMIYEIMIAITVLSIALIPLAYNIKAEMQMLSALYYRSVAEQVLDGHIKFLALGEYKKYTEGQQKYIINNKAFNQLPKGNITLEISKTEENSIKIILQWETIKKHGIGKIYKEIIISQ